MFGLFLHIALFLFFLMTLSVLSCVFGVVINLGKLTAFDILEDAKQTSWY